MPDTNWTTRRWHRDWLEARATDLFDLFQHHAVNPKGGFFDLDATGRPSGHVRQLHQTSRMVHCFAIAARLGRPGAEPIVDQMAQPLPKAQYQAGGHQQGERCAENPPQIGAQKRQQQPKRRDPGPPCGLTARR